jgi:hypothetical protein
MSKARNRHEAGCVHRLAYSSSTLKMKATYSSQTSVDSEWTTRRYIPVDVTLHNHRGEDLRPYRKKKFSMPSSVLMWPHEVSTAITDGFIFLNTHHQRHRHHYQYFSSFDGLGPVACSHSEWIWNYESYRELVGLLGQGIRLLQAATYTGQHKHKIYIHA